MKTKFLALLLAALMCTSVLAACSSGKESSQTTSNTNQNVEETDEVIAKVDNYIADLAADHNLDGATFTYVGGGGQTAEKEEEIGNIENDALYKRQRELEETLGITWESVVADFEEGSNQTGHAVVEFVKQAVMADTKVYDLVYGTLIVTTQPLFNEDLLESVSDFTVTDLSADWWPSTLEETHSIGGKLYFLTGPIMTSYYGDGSCLLFNKAVAEDYGIEAPYQDALDGTWTFDRMFEVASAIPFNTSGSGEYRYGDPEGLAILFGSGMTITKFDDAGIPYVESSLPSQLVDLASKFSPIMGDETQTAITTHTSNSWEDINEKYGYENFTDMFADGNFLFYFTNTGEATGLREKDVEFGILPIPKATVDQDQYYSYADNWNARFCAVPRCTRDISNTDVVVEAMAALSLKHIRPAYYDKLLKGRSTHDTDSKEMLDIIFDTKIYDIVDIYSLGNSSSSGAFVVSLEKAIEFDDSSISSDYTVYAKMANSQIKSIMKMVNR